MKIKKMLFFISCNILILSNIKGMESENDLQMVPKNGLLKEIPHANAKYGDPDAPAFCIISPEVLQNNPVFKKLKEKAKQLEQAYDIIVEDLILMPQEQQNDFLEDVQLHHPEFTAVSQIISSTIFNKDADTTPTVDNEVLQQEGLKELKEIFNSIRLDAETAQPDTYETEEININAIISDNPTTTATSGLSWYLWYQLKMYGESAALKYAVDNNEFDANNTDHINLLKKNIDNCHEAKKSINSLMQQQCNELKGSCCYAMVALLDQFSTHVSTLHSEIEKIITEQTQKKETFCKQFEESYEQQNQQLMELTKIRHQHKIKIDKTNQEERDVRKKQLKNTQALLSDVALHIADMSAIATRVKRYEKVVAEISQQFAIENNK